MEMDPRRGTSRTNSFDQETMTGLTRRPGRREERRNSVDGVESFANSYRTSVILSPAARYNSEESESDTTSNANSTMGLARYLNASTDGGRNKLNRHKSTETGLPVLPGNIRRSRPMDDSSDMSDASLSLGGVLGQSSSYATSQSPRVANSSADLSNLAMVALMHQSSLTLPTANMARNDTDAHVKLKKEQLIESVVWFSFHTPKTVMEDLITHELGVWRNSTPVKSRQTRRGGRRKTGGEAASVSSMDDLASSADVLDGQRLSENLIKLQGKGNHSFMQLPNSVPRESALLFVDMSGFTKLSNARC
jgi:hypothetical protein